MPRNILSIGVHFIAGNGVITSKRAGILSKHQKILLLRMYPSLINILYLSSD